MLGLLQHLGNFLLIRMAWGQGRFICGKGGHMVTGCSEKHKWNTHKSTLCLRCGEKGHDMFGSAHDIHRMILRDVPSNVRKRQLRPYARNVSDRFKGESSAHSRSKDFATISAPHDALKTIKEKAPI